jgi:hypothetical protein
MLDAFIEFKCLNGQFFDLPQRDVIQPGKAVGNVKEQNHRWAV